MRKQLDKNGNIKRTREGDPVGMNRLMSYGRTIGYALPVRDKWYKRPRCYMVYTRTMDFCGYAGSLDTAFTVLSKGPEYKPGF